MNRSKSAPPRGTPPRAALMLAALLATTAAAATAENKGGGESEGDGPGHHQGIDVSHHDDTIHWPSVQASGITFAYIKATEGLDFTDPLFQKNWADADDACIFRGAYHFFRPLDDGTAQARFFLKTVFSSTGGKNLGELIPVVDVEIADGVDAATILAELKEWLDIVEEAVGIKPMIYTDVGFWNGMNKDSEAAAFASYPLWIAEYGVEQPTVPGAWKSWTLWQYTEDAAVTGVGGPVDQSRTQGPLHRLTATAPKETE